MYQFFASPHIARAKHTHTPGFLIFLTERLDGTVHDGPKEEENFRGAKGHGNRPFAAISEGSRQQFGLFGKKNAWVVQSSVPRSGLGLQYIR